MDLTDQQLVERILAGSPEDFAPIMRRYNQRLFRTVRAIVRSDSDAEDVLQEAYVSAYRHLHQFAGRARLSTWLTRIAVNAALGHLRRKPLAPEHIPVPTPLDNPERALSQRQLRGALEASIDALPEAYRMVFMLRVVQGLSGSETAACIGVDEQVVRKRLQRARQSLRKTLTRTDPAIAFSFAGEQCDRIVATVLRRISNASAGPREPWPQNENASRPITPSSP